MINAMTYVHCLSWSMLIKGAPPLAIGSFLINMIANQRLKYKKINQKGCVKLVRGNILYERICSRARENNMCIKYKAF